MARNIIEPNKVTNIVEIVMALLIVPTPKKGLNKYPAKKAPITATTILINKFEESCINSVAIHPIRAATIK